MDRGATVHGVAELDTTERLHFLSVVPFGEGNGSPLQCSCLENPMDRGAWWATVYEVAKTRTRLSNSHTHTHTHTSTTRVRILRSFITTKILYDITTSTFLCFSALFPTPGEHSSPFLKFCHLKCISGNHTTCM